MSNTISFRAEDMDEDAIEEIRKYLERNQPGTRHNKSDAIRFAIWMQFDRIRQEHEKERAAQ